MIVVRNPALLSSPEPVATAPTRLLVAVVLVIVAVFFICEHNLNISQAAAYTQSLDEMAVTALGGNLLRRLMFFLLGGVGLLLAAASLRQRWNGSLLLLAGLCIVPLWCWASLLWAQDFGMCARRLIVLSCFCCGALGVGRRFALNDIIWIAFGAMLCFALIGVLAEIRLGTFRPWSSDYRFSGSLHPNTQGMYLALLAMSALTLARVRPRYFWQYVAVMLGALGLLLLTKSRTANAAALVGLVAIGLLQTPWRLQVVVGGGGAWLMGMLYLSTSIFGIDLKRDLMSAIFLGREEQTESFTGRGEIWPEVMFFIQQRPLLGYGYESFWTPEKIDIVSTAVQWAVREAHCAYLEVILWLGIVGLVLGLLTVLATAVIAAREYFRTQQPAYAMIVGLVGFALVDMLMESGMVVTQAVVFFCVALMWNLAVNQDANRPALVSPPVERAAVRPPHRIRPRRRSSLPRPT